MNDLDVIGPFSNAGVYETLCLVGCGDGGDWSATHFGGMPARDGGTGPRRPHIREVRAIFRLQLLDQLKAFPTIEHVELGCDAQYKRLMGRLLYRIGKVDMGIKESG